MSDIQNENQDDRASVESEVKAALWDLMPWGIAVVLHAAVILLSIFIFTQVMYSPSQSQTWRDPIPTLGGFPGLPSNQAPALPPEPDAKKPGPGGNPLALPGVKPMPAIPDAGPHRPNAPLAPAFPSSPGKEPPVIAIVSVNPSGPGIFKLPGGPPPGNVVGPPGDNEGPGGPGGPGVTITEPPGTPSGPRRFMFVIDASGSMIEGMPYVITQLKKFIHDLPQGDKFSVVFIQGDRALQVVGHELVDVRESQGFCPANDGDKTAAYEALDKVHPAGTSSAGAALRVAFSDKYPPTYVYILSTNIIKAGQYEMRRDALLAAVAKVNPAEGKPMIGPEGKTILVPPAVINAIQFLNPDPLIQQGFAKATLEDLVEQNNARIAKYWAKYAPGYTPLSGGYNYYGADELFGKP